MVRVLFGWKKRGIDQRVDVRETPEAPRPDVEIDIGAGALIQRCRVVAIEGPAIVREAQELEPERLHLAQRDRECLCDDRVVLFGVRPPVLDGPEDGAQKGPDVLGPLPERRVAELERIDDEPGRLSALYRTRPPACTARET